MKHRILSLFILLFIIIFSTGCSGAARTPTGDPLESQPTAQAAPAATRLVESSTPTASLPPPPTQTKPVTSQSGGVYTVDLTAADFVDVIDNPYFPLPPGAKWEYEIRLANGTVQKDTLEVLKEKRTVNGIQATVVRDTVSVGDQLVEDTYDWFAQDQDGNVWYVGEAVDNYIAGALTGHAGSWEWGVDGALPGIIMWADPSAHLNEEYYQEYYVGRAEDQGKVLSVSERVTVPFNSYDRVVETLDFSALEPLAKEHKFYAPGIGLIQEIEGSGGDVVVLIKYTPPQ